MLGIISNEIYNTTKDKNYLKDHPDTNDSLVDYKNNDYLKKAS